MKRDAALVSAVPNRVSLRKPDRSSQRYCRLSKHPRMAFTVLCAETAVQHGRLHDRSNPTPDPRLTTIHDPRPTTHDPRPSPTHDRPRPATDDQRPTTILDPRPSTQDSRLSSICPACLRSVSMEESNADGSSAISIATSETSMTDKALVLETPARPARKTNDASCTPNPPSEIGSRADASAIGTVATKT